MSKSVNKVYRKYNLKEKGYSIIRMDFEQVIYKDYGDFDIEVSGLDNYREKIIKYGRVYIWQNKCKIVKSIGYTSFDELNDILYIIDNFDNLDEIMKYKFKNETDFGTFVVK